MNTVDHTIFHLELDEVRNNNLTHKYSSSIELSYAGAEPFIDFDSYKGSFLHLKAQESLTISPKLTAGIPLKEETDYAFNFYFCYEKKTSQGSLTLVTINNEISIKAEKYEGVNALVIYQGNERVFVLKNDVAGVKIRQNRWYNVHVALDAGEDQKRTLSMILDGMAGESPLTGTLSGLTSISKIIIGGNDEGDILKIGDFYLLRDAAADIPYIIKKGINPNLKLDWINSLGFDLFSKQNEELKKGIYLNNDPTDFLLKLSTSHQYLKLIPDPDRDHIVLKFKKGLINTAGLHESKVFRYEDLGTDILLYCRLEEGQDLLLPGLEFINLSGQSYAVVQCQLQHVTVETDSYGIKLTEPLFFDKKIDLYDLRGNTNCPFEVLILGDRVLLNDGKTGNQLKLRLYNRSDEQVVVPAPDSNNRICRFTFTSNYMGLLKQDTLQNVKITVPGFLHKRNQQDILSVEISKEIKINPKGFIDILFENLIAANPSVDYPSGDYIFHLKYENIKNYANGKLPFCLKTGRIYSKWEENEEKHYLDNFSSIHSEKAQINQLSSDILKLKDQLDLLSDSFKISLKGKDVITITDDEIAVHKNLKVNDEYVGMPIGSIIAYAGVGPLPDGWLICNGDPVPETCKKLRELMDENKYCTPNLTDRFIMGDNSLKKRNPDFTGGRKSFKLNRNNVPFPKFVDSISFSSGISFNDVQSGGFGNHYNCVTNLNINHSFTKDQGNENPEEIDINPKYYKLLYIIKAL